MPTSLLLLPDFLLILCGWLLLRYGRFERSMWQGIERLVYYVLFPALLFQATSRVELDAALLSGLIPGAALVVGSGIALGYAARWVLRPELVLWASGMQTAFRFNAYVGLAVAGRIGGEQGIALMAMVIGCMVPLCNLAAVWVLARHGNLGLGRELMRNPLIIATVGGLLINLLGLRVPELADMAIGRLGAAAIALGLLSVGAGLVWAGATRARGLLVWFVGVKLLMLPLVAIAAAHLLGLPPLQMQVLVLFAALPTASSAYILAARMGGDGPFVAAVISVGMLLAAVTTPFWIAWVR